MEKLACVAKPERQSGALPTYLSCRLPTCGALRACGPSSASLPFAVRPLPPPASANPRAGLRRRIRLLAPRVLRGACAEPRPPVSLRSALGRPARSSRNVLPCPVRAMTLNDNILEHMGEAASKASAVSGGQSREEFFAGRRAGRRAGSPRWYRAKAKDAHAIHFGDGLSAGAREKPRSGQLPAASHRADRPECARMRSAISSGSAAGASSCGRRS